MNFILLLFSLLTIPIFILADKIHMRINYYKYCEVKNKIETSLQKFYAEGCVFDLVKQHDEKYFTSLISVIKQNLPPNSIVLDLGCGSGYSSYLLSKRKYNVIGLDLNPFPEQLKLNGSEELQYVVGDALTLPFKENSFDAVVLKDVIEHITDVEKLLLSVKKVLKPNGVLIILSPCLITPVRPFVGLIRLLTGKNGIPVWGENLGMCISNIFKFSLLLYHKIVQYCMGKVDFRYKLPDLEKAKYVGGDADAVYWANPYDIINFLTSQNFEIIEKKRSIVNGFVGETRVIALRR
jgi:ubiquinone/menaquinone biosynthesis C-methylase UbiE